MAKKEKDGNWFKRHKILTGILILFVIGVMGSVGNGGKNNAGTDTATSGSNAATSTPEEKTDFKVGETATFDDKSITVTEIQRNYDTGNQFAQPESGKEFVIVTINITNNSDSTLDYSTFEFKMQDSNGVQQNEAIMALAEGKLSSGALAKGGKVTGKLAYEVPKDDAGLKLLYQNYSLFNNKTITFSL